MVKRADVNCFNCLGIIDLKQDKYVILQTNNADEIVEQNYYHFECWKHYFKKAVEQRLHEIQSRVMKGVRGKMETLMKDVKL